MKKSLIIAAGLMAAALSTTSASAAPLGGISSGAAGAHEGVVEQVQYAYTRVCSYGPRGWFLRNYRGEIISCRPRRPIGFGWGWREEGGRSGWYHGRDRRWR
jgi:hypothetical protein